MSRSARPQEALSLLHQRLVSAEEEAEALIRDVGALGVSRDQMFGSAERTGAARSPGSPPRVHRVLRDEGSPWQRCESLASRVCRVESLLQTLRLTVFRLETERELDPHTAHLKQQLAELQQEGEERRRARRMEAVKLRDQLQQACQERDDARTQVQRLGGTLEAAAAAKVDVALAADELKIVKLEMSQKLMEMKEQMREESDRSAEALKSHAELLRRAEETERVLETERRQALLLQSDCQTLHAEAQTGRRHLEEERDRSRQLEEHCQRLREQTEMKDSVVSELKTELKSVRPALQRQRAENVILLREGRELRAAADGVQTLNQQLQSQCSQLTSALRSLTEENEKHQASLKAERSRAAERLQERQLDAAGRSVHAELQVALTQKVSLQLELEELKGEHARLLQSSSAAQETTAAQRKLFERAIKRLREELSAAKKEEEATRKDLEASKTELCLVVTKLEDDRRHLESQLREAKREVGSLSSASQNRQDENRRLMGKVTASEQQQHAMKQVDQMLKDLTDKNKEEGQLKISELDGARGPAGGVSLTLENIPLRTGLDSPTPQQELGGQERELATLEKDRLQAQREIRRHQVEVEKLQRLLTSTHSKNDRALESLHKALETAKVDNRRLAQRVEQAALTNSTLHSKLERARERHQAAVTLRDEELREARAKIGDLSAELGAARQQTKRDDESSLKTLQREISELKMAVEHSSGDPSKANRELCRRASELEWQVSKQKACIREQRRRLRQRQKSGGSQDGPQTVERSEENIRTLQEKEDDELREVRMDSEQISRKREEDECERWTSIIRRWEAKRDVAHVAGGSEPVRTHKLTTH